VSTRGPASRCELLADGAFVVHDFLHAPPFSNFFPGIAGLWGVPLWLFYVNRGQAVVSFGVQDKDNAILEFQSLNLHLRRAALEGFRTFIRLRRGKAAAAYYEPFAEESAGRYEVKNKLVETGFDLTLEETNATLGLLVRVNYFPVPNEPFAALARTVTVENTAEQAVECEVLDGLPMVVPQGLGHQHLKMMPFVCEAFVESQNEGGTMGFFRLGSLAHDVSDIVLVSSGNFYFAFREGESGHEPAPVIVDPSLVFGDYRDLAAPHAFLETHKFSIPAAQDIVCQTACAFSHFRFSLQRGASQRLRSCAGTASSLESARDIAAAASGPGYFDRKRAEAACEVAKVRDTFFVHGANPRLDRYIQQSFLDNVLRGGLPVSVDAGGKKIVYHVYSRKHGDLERDYNFFRLEPTFFSQGNGNFRDVNQNRRNDVWFNPGVGADNVKYFFNLIQTDGYNPLHCEGVQFRAVGMAEADAALGECIDGAVPGELRAALEHGLTPGEAFRICAQHGVRLRVDRRQFLERLLGVSEKVETASFGEGYWTDHWFYCFDLMESFLAIYPDRLREVLLDDTSFTYWDTDFYVKGRAEKYVWKPGLGVRHVDSLGRSERKAEMIASRRHSKHQVRTGFGKHDIYRTNLLEKIICVLVNKIASLSPSGMGIDMEAGRPGWCDAVNGLPSLFGAGTPEAYQILRVIRLVRGWMAQAGAKQYSQPLPVELAAFFGCVAGAVSARLQDTSADADFALWQALNLFKEEYRTKVLFGFDGAQEQIAAARLLEFFDDAERLIAANLERAVLPCGLPATYVTHAAVEYDLLEGVDHETGLPLPMLNSGGCQCVRVKKFKPHLFAPFLEGCVHRLSVETEPHEALDLYTAVRESPLYDRPLGMYKVNADLDTESKEQGRTGVFAKGWLENESVFMHMQSKYLLALLSKGLYEQFFDDIRRCLPAFLDADVYGRSPLENVSFIVASVHPRRRYHGRGVQPRLSGTNAEIVHMALIMCFGEKPFSHDGVTLSLTLSPVLADWMFSTAEEKRTLTRFDGTVEELCLPGNSFSALFLGRTLVVYLNPSRKSTFGENAVQPVEYLLTYGNGSEACVKNRRIEGQAAYDVREGRVGKMVVRLG